MFFKEKRCTTCSQRKICQGEATAWFFIIIGLIATVSIRLVTVLMHLGPFYGKLAWYVGVSGFVIFFMYKYRVFKQRAHIIDEASLIEKLNNNDIISVQDREKIAVLLCKIRSSKERFNYLFIFVASIIAFSLAIFFDFIR